jgi:O-antigen ligase
LSEQNSGNGWDAKRVWPVALWVVLLAGICVAWSPRYWAVSVAITGISIVAVSWLVFSGIELWQGGAGGFRLPWQTALVAPIGCWGFLQMAGKTTVVPQLTLYSSLVWGMGAVVFIVAAQMVRGRGGRGLFLQLLLWSLTALAVAAMLQFYSNPSMVFGVFEGPETVFGTYISRNQFAAMMELAAPIALWSMLERNAFLGGLCYVMIAAATITAGSRAGFILSCAELAIFLAIVMISRRREAKTLVLVFAGLALVVTAAASIAGTDELRRRFEDSDPYVVRRELVKSTSKLIAERPGFGHGMGTWSAIYPHVATFDVALIANEAHNDWAQWAAEGGIPFFVLMAALVLSMVMPAVRSIWGLGLLSVMAHSYVDFPLREPALSFLWFALAGALCGTRERKSGRESSGVRAVPVEEQLRAGE